MVVTQKIIVDTLRQRTADVLYAKQGDTNSRFLRATVCENGKKINIPSDSNVFLSVVRSDGMANSFVGEAQSDGTVVLPVDEWVLTVPGRCSCSVSIVRDDEVVTSLSFYLNVQAAEWPIGWIVVHVAAYKALVPGTYNIKLQTGDYQFELTQPIPVNGAIAFNKAFTEAATFNSPIMIDKNVIETGITVSAGSAGTKLAQNANNIFLYMLDELEEMFTLVDNHIVTIQGLEFDIESAEQARAAAEEARDTSESGRASAEDARVAAESARETAEQERVAAEHERQAADAVRPTREEFERRMKANGDKLRVWGDGSYAVGNSSTDATQRGISEQSIDAEIIAEWESNEDRFMLIRAPGGLSSGNNNLILAKNGVALGNGCFIAPGANSGIAGGTGAKVFYKYMPELSKI